jgi:acetyltransferase-like isoleucine patch superfamily enzyme
MRLIYNLLCLAIAKFFVLLTKVTGFYNTSVFLSKLSFGYGNKIRFYYYRSLLTNVGQNVLFPWGTVFTHKDISIGNNVRFGPMNTIGLVNFGDDILIGQGVHFLSGMKQHGMQKGKLIREQNGLNERIFIGNDIWVGAGCIVMANVNNGAVVGAGTVITKEVNENAVMVGSTAKELRLR